jgi:redox-sensing transcriptional repressor
MGQRLSDGDRQLAGVPRKSSKIPEATVSRLPLYYRALLGLSEMDVPTVSSDQLAMMAGVNAAKVRKDLSYLGSYGTRGVGYDVEFLLRHIGKELGLEKPWTVAIVGVGNLGSALANYKGFSARGFRVAALFDADPKKIGTSVGDLTIDSVEDIESVCKKEGVEIGIVAVPAAHAQQVTDRLVAAGVKSILNFAPIEVRVPQDVVMRKVDVAVELQILAFYRRQDLTRTGISDLGDLSEFDIASAVGRATPREGR